jgi:hypothetical protein
VIPEEAKTLDVFAEPENRMAIVIIPMVVEAEYLEKYRYGVSSIHETNEIVSPVHMGYSMHIALKDIVCLKASQLMESGIYTRNFKYGGVLEDFKKKPQAIGPQVLTLRHLEAGFVIIVVSLGLSGIAFLVECAPILIKKLSRMCLACYIVINFTRMNKML